MTRTIVGVLRGGTSSEYDLSLQTGAAMIAALPDNNYTVRDIFIDRSGVWYVRGIPVTPVRALSQVDVVLNALHGGVGEDGTVTRILERTGIPYAGSKPLPSGLALNKARARQVLSQADIRIPKGIAFKVSSGLTTGEMAQVIFRRFPPPYVVKPTSEGASRGIRLAGSVVDLPDAIGDTLDQYGFALVEEFVKGRHAVVGIIEKFRNQELYALPPAHIILPLGARIIEGGHHRDDSLSFQIPSNYSDVQKQMLIETARKAHRTLGLTHFSRADFIVTPKQIYLLEMSTNPGLYKGSCFPHMLASVGSSVLEFLQHSISLARSH